MLPPLLTFLLVALLGLLLSLSDLPTLGVEWMLVLGLVFAGISKMMFNSEPKDPDFDRHKQNRTKE
jgi:hypothetical protein